MLRPATFIVTPVMLHGKCLYQLTDRCPGDHGGVYVEIEHVDDLLKVMDSAAAQLISVERSEEQGYALPPGKALGNLGRELLSVIEKLGRKVQ